MARRYSVLAGTNVRCSVVFEIASDRSGSARKKQGKTRCAKTEKGSLKHIFRLPFYIGAGERSRTLDLLITNELLYRLSYTGDAVFRPRRERRQKARKAEF